MRLHRYHNELHKRGAVLRRRLRPAYRNRKSSDAGFRSLDTQTCLLCHTATQLLVSLNIYTYTPHGLHLPHVRMYGSIIDARRQANKRKQTNMCMYAGTTHFSPYRHVIWYCSSFVLCTMHRTESDKLRSSPDGRRNTSTVCLVVCHNLHVLLFQRCAAANIFDVNAISRADIQTVYSRAFCAAAKFLSKHYPLPHHPLHPLLFLYNFTLNHVILI
jgi:hypothetical protein